MRLTISDLYASGLLEDPALADVSESDALDAYGRALASVTGLPVALCGHSEACLLEFPPELEGREADIWRAAVARARTELLQKGDKGNGVGRL